MNPGSRRRLVAALAVVFAPCAFAQMPDMAAAAKWEKVQVVHFEVVGEVKVKGQQIPPADADLYADITDKVRLSFDWDRKKGVIVGKPTIVNETGTATHVVGLDKLGGKGRCPTGKINGTYEHFDVVEIRQAQPGQALELVGKRIHPETQVAEACSNNLKTYKGATKAAKEYIAPPDPQMLAFGKMMSKPPLRISDDGKSIVMTAQNSPWVWTFTPTAK
ncbi:MAG TPA: hypothetical protein VFV90_08810 [Usitatibacter sp.]|nr:hypothetical protein [Usitatibacter sp.]